MEGEGIAVEEEEDSDVVNEKLRVSKYIQSLMDSEKEVNRFTQRV